MKKQLKLAAAAAILAVTATASFAASGDAPPVTTPTFDLAITDADNMHDLARAELSIGFGNNSSDQNVGLVSQTGDGNIAYIQQTSTTGGNFAAIIQDQLTSTAANVGYIYQTGNNNRSVIYQH